MEGFAGRQEFVQLVQRLNKIAQRECSKFNIRFIDNAAEADKLLEMAGVSEVASSPLFFRYWPHVAGFITDVDELFLSLILTQRMIRDICN